MIKFCSQVTEEIEGTRFNTGISAMMEFINAAYKVLFFEKLELYFFYLFLDYLNKVDRSNPI